MPMPSPKSLLFFADKLPPATGGVESHGKYFIEHFSKHPAYVFHIITKDPIGQDILIQAGRSPQVVSKHTISQMAVDLVFYNSGAWIEAFSLHKQLWPQAQYIYRTGGNEILKAPLVDNFVYEHSARQRYWVEQLNATIDILITNSKFTEQRLQALGITCKFVKVVGGAYSQPLEKPVRSIPLFVSAARFVPYKNHQLLVDIFYVLHQRGFKYHLKLYGDGILLSKIEQLVCNYKLQDKIELLGAVDNHLVCREIAQADFYIQLSQDILTPVPGGNYLHTEGMGRSILEAIAANTFVIAGKAGALDEIVTASNGILLDLTYPEKIVQTILALGYNPPLVTNKVDYSWEGVFSKYDTIFSCLCES